MEIQRWLCGLAAVGLVASSVVAQQPSAIDRALTTAVERKEVPGIVAMAVNRRGVVVYEGAFGADETAAGRPMTLDSIFRIASMTKPVTTVAAMQLVERRQIALEDPVSKYLPEFLTLQVVESFDSATGAYKLRPAIKTVTVRHLMTHTSGLGYNFTDAIVRDFKPINGETYAAGPLVFEPGEKWLYGTNTDWLGRLVESVSGQTLDAYFREHIFEPLGMRDSYFNVPPDKQARLVNTSHRQADGVLVEDPRIAPQPVRQFNGGGGLSSTAADYARFMRMLLNGGELNGTRILSAETVALMAQNQIGAVSARALRTAMPARSRDFSFIADGRDKWGLGFLITSDRVAGKRSPGSLSWGGIFNTYFWIDRTRGVAGTILMQFLPFADEKALGVYDAFERGVYAAIR